MLAQVVSRVCVGGPQQAAGAGVAAVRRHAVFGLRRALPARAHGALLAAPGLALPPEPPRPRLRAPRTQPPLALRPVRLGAVRGGRGPGGEG